MPKHPKRHSRDSVSFEQTSNQFETQSHDYLFDSTKIVEPKLNELQQKETSEVTQASDGEVTRHHSCHSVLSCGVLFVPCFATTDINLPSRRLTWDKFCSDNELFLSDSNFHKNMSRKGRTF